MYISASTQSISIGVDGTTPPTLANLTPSAPNCSSSSGTLTCTVNVPAPVGTDSFSITTYDQAVDATGNEPSNARALSTAVMSAAIAANAPNNVAITLNGIVAKIVLSVNPGATFVRTAANIALTVNAQDADGNTIVGPGNFSAPITLANSDASGATTLSAATIAGPSATALTIAYNGAELSSATFSATAPGVPPANVTPATLTITSGVAATYSKGAFNGDNLSGIAKGPDGNYWFGDQTANAIDVIDPNGKLLHSYALGKTALNQPITPIDITNGPGDGNLYFIASGNAGSIRASDGTIGFYPLPSGNNPVGSQIALGSDKALYFTEPFSGNLLGRLDPTKPASATNPQELARLFSANSNPMGIASGPDGNLWICEFGNGLIARYNVTGPNKGTADEFPVTTPNSNPSGIAAGADGNLWFNESGSQGARIAKISPAGTVTEFLVPSGRADLASRGGAIVAATPDGNVFFSEDGRDGKFLRVNTVGTITLTQIPVTPPTSINNLAVDAVGSLYFTQQGNAGLGHFVY